MKLNLEDIADAMLEEHIDEITDAILADIFARNEHEVGEKREEVDQRDSWERDRRQIF